MSSSWSSVRSIGNQPGGHVRWWFRERWEWGQQKQVAFREIEWREKTKGKKNVFFFFFQRQNRKCTRKEGERNLLQRLPVSLLEMNGLHHLHAMLLCSRGQGERGEALPLFLLRHLGSADILFTVWKFQDTESLSQTSKWLDLMFYSPRALYLSEDWGGQGSF